MTAHGAITQRGIVNIESLRGYDQLNKIEKKRKLLAQKPVRYCSLDSCKAKLSKYNDTDFCALHQRGNVPLDKFL